MDSKVKFVDYERPQESITIKIIRFLLSKNLDTCNTRGEASTDTGNEIGILLDDPKAESRKYLLGLIKKRALREFVGIIRCDNSSTDNQTIVFELYGRKHVEWSKNLANELTSILDTEIVIKLMCEEPKVEIIYEYNSAY